MLWTSHCCLPDCAAGVGRTNEKACWFTETRDKIKTCQSSSDRINENWFLCVVWLHLTGWSRHVVSSFKPLGSDTHGENLLNNLQTRVSFPQADASFHTFYLKNMFLMPRTSCSVLNLSALVATAMTAVKVASNGGVMLPPPDQENSSYTLVIQYHIWCRNIDVVSRTIQCKPPRFIFLQVRKFLQQFYLSNQRPHVLSPGRFSSYICLVVWYMSLICFPDWLKVTFHCG